MTALTAQVFAQGSEAEIQDGDLLIVVVGASASGATPTLLVGQLGALPILDSAGNVPPAGFLSALQQYALLYRSGSLYALQPPRNKANVTATADGLTTGLIPANASWLNITAGSDANAIITLPAGKAGMKIEGWIGATGCEVRTPATSNETINNVDSDASEAAIPASSLVVLWCVADGTWLLQCFSNLGAVRTAIIPD